MCDFVCRNVSHAKMLLHWSIMHCQVNFTVKTLNIGTPRPATVVVLNLKQFNFTMK